MIYMLIKKRIKAVLPRSFFFQKDDLETDLILHLISIHGAPGQKQWIETVIVE